MPEALFCILIALVKLEGYGHKHQIEAEAGYDFTSLSRGVGFLLEHGLVVRKFAGYYEITERGKIAVAIEVGRRTKIKAKGYRLGRWGGAVKPKDRLTTEFKAKRARLGAAARWAKHREQGISP